MTRRPGRRRHGTPHPPLTGGLAGSPWRDHTAFLLIADVADLRVELGRTTEPEDGLLPRDVYVAEPASGPVPAPPAACRSATYLPGLDLDADPDLPQLQET